jgi:murein L,D-transpeptidase YcbB/YkuD
MVGKMGGPVGPADLDSAASMMIGHGNLGRSLLRAALVASALAGAVHGARADSSSPIDEVLQNGNAEWSDSFDAASVSAADVRTTIPILSPQILNSLQAAIAQYSDIVAKGGWPTVPANKVLKIGMADPAVVALRQRLAISGDLPAEAASGASGASTAFDSYVDAAVKRFQARHGIQPDGVLGAGTYAALNIPAPMRLTQLANNFTRLKSLLGKPLPARFVMVNIPAASVEVVENGVVAQRHTAVVGKVDRPSPIVNSKITEINFHPYWTVPASIIRKDLIPIMQKDPTYLDTWKIRVYDKKGQEVPPTAINWQTDDATNYRFRQDPGDQNSLGIVKINFPSPEGVYMHDTPHKGTFNDDYRFDSSGCVRVQNIRELIAWILKDTPGWTSDQVEAELRGTDRLDVKVVNPVELHWVYITAWSTTDGIVNFRNDIYNLDGLEQYTDGADDSGATGTPAAAAPATGGDPTPLPGTTSG